LRLLGHRKIANFTTPLLKKRTPITRLPLEVEARLNLLEDFFFDKKKSSADAVSTKRGKLKKTF